MTLRKRLDAGETLYTAWSAIPDPLVAEFLARAGFDAVTLDMQHGCHSTESVMRGVPAVMLAGKPAIVRIPVGRFDMASRALDFGAAAVIAPMVNSLADARLFAAAMKFPPVGERSWGPTRVLGLRGEKDPQAYLEAANGDTLAIAMIETRAALAVLDEILGLPGIDGVFVGPSDFSIAWSGGKRIDPGNGDMLKGAADVAERTRKAGKIPCTLAITGEAARKFRDMGFRLIALGSDFGYLTAGAAALLQASKG
ncbi:MAG TPA: aldolase/citrate lyase family protein [Propylenella sp.]